MDEITFNAGRKLVFPIGMDISTQVVLSCSDCGTKLAEVVVTETNEMREERELRPQFTKFKADKCYKCGGSSFPTDILEGSVFAGSLRDDYEIDVLDTDVEKITDEYNDARQIIFTTLTVRKRKNA